MATIDRDIATHSGGVYLVRVEDTDQSREAEGALAQFAHAFDYFGTRSAEDDQHGSAATRHDRCLPVGLRSTPSSPNRNAPLPAA